MFLYLFHQPFWFRICTHGHHRVFSSRTWIFYLRETNVFLFTDKYWYYARSYRMNVAQQNDHHNMTSLAFRCCWSYICTFILPEAVMILILHRHGGHLLLRIYDFTICLQLNESILIWYTDFFIVIFFSV